MGKKGKGKDKAEDAAAAAAALKEAEGEKVLRDLQIEAKRLKTQCEAEEKLYNQFLQEREKINYFWIVEKKSLSERQAELRNKERELQDLEERQQIELKMFQQRLKHLRYHQQDEVVELKTDAELALKLQEDHHRVTEAEIKKDKRALRGQMKESEVAQEDFIRMLKLEQDQKILLLRQEYDRNARDLQQKYGLKMKTIREDMEKARKKQIAKIEESKNQHIQRCMQKNMKDFQDIKVYYGDITSSNLDLIKRLKEEHAEIKKRESADAKQMFDLQQKNKQLSEPLRRAHQDVDRLQDELRMYEMDKKKLNEVKERIKDSERTLNRMQFQQEVLHQQLGRVGDERDTLYSKFQGAIYEVQQKSGLRNLLLEKRLDAVEESLEVTDAQVSELLISANVDRATAGGISQKLDQVIQYKNDIITELHEEVQKIKDAHRQMIKTFECKLAEYGIPVEELGFQPALMD